MNETHKNYWHYNKYKKPTRILSKMKKYSSRQTKDSIYREDTGLACASRSFLWRKGKRIGNNVKIGGGSGVINDIPDNQQVMGYPAVSLKNFIKQRKNK